jgi:hypothetical protein
MSSDSLMPALSRQRNCQIEGPRARSFSSIVPCWYLVLTDYLSSEGREWRINASCSSRHLTMEFWTTAISCILDTLLLRIEISGDEEVPQATKGDDSVSWIGRVK